MQSGQWRTLNFLGRGRSIQLPLFGCQLLLLILDKGGSLSSNSGIGDRQWALLGLGRFLKIDDCCRL